MCADGRSCEFFLMCWMTAGLLDGSCGGIMFACCQRKESSKALTDYNLVEVPRDQTRPLSLDLYTETADDDSKSFLRNSMPPPPPSRHALVASMRALSPFDSFSRLSLSIPSIYLLICLHLFIFLAPFLSLPRSVVFLCQSSIALPRTSHVPSKHVPVFFFISSLFRRSLSPGNCTVPCRICPGRYCPPATFLDSVAR